MLHMQEVQVMQNRVLCDKQKKIMQPVGFRQGYETWRKICKPKKRSKVIKIKSDKNRETIQKLKVV